MSVAFGCASVPKTDAAADADAKRFVAQPGTASIYYSRGEGIAGNKIIDVQLDGQVIGALAPKTFLMVSVQPGHHTVGVTGPSNVEQLPVDVVAGNLYFYGVSMQWAGPGVRHRHIQLLSDAEGRSAVNSKSRAVATTFP